MELGAHLRELWGHKRAIAFCAVLALVFAVLSIYRISLMPPRLQSRTLEIAAASTQVLVDTKKSKITDLNATYVDFTSLTVRADLLGNIMASLPVRAYIGRLIGIDPSLIQASAPVTANVPRNVVEPNSGGSAMDIIASPDQYKLQIQADPAVPILRIYTQAPTQAKAVRLANASIQALRSYLDGIANRQGIPLNARVYLEQFGGAHGGVVNPGVSIQVALLTFLVVFALSFWVVLVLERMRRAWQLSGVSREPA